MRIHATNNSKWVTYNNKLQIVSPLLSHPQRWHHSWSHPAIKNLTLNRCTKRTVDSVLPLWNKEMPIQIKSASVEVLQCRNKNALTKHLKTTGRMTHSNPIKKNGIELAWTRAATALSFGAIKTIWLHFHPTRNLISLQFSNLNLLEPPSFCWSFSGIRTSNDGIFWQPLLDKHLKSAQGAR